MAAMGPSGVGSAFAALSSAATVARVAVQVRWRVVVPATVTVRGVSGLRPQAMSSAAAAATVCRVVETTRVVSDGPTSFQQRSLAVAASTNRTSPLSGTPA
jgi:ribosomal protein S11